METVLIIFLFLLVAAACYIVYSDLPSKFTKLEENFGGFMNRRLVRFEFERSPLHTIVYGASGTGRTYFIGHYLKLYLDGNTSAKPFGVPRTESVHGWPDTHQEQDNKNIIIVCNDERDWIDPESGAPYAGFEMDDINMITMKNILKFQNSLIVLDDIGDNFNKDVVYYFTEGRNKNIQMIVMCHKPAQIEDMARMNCDTIYITTYNGADLFTNFNTTYESKHDFHGIIQELNNSYYKCTNGTDDALRYGMIKYNKKEEIFIIIDRNRTMIYDSRIGLLDLKALSLKDELEKK